MQLEDYSTESRFSATVVTTERITPEGTDEVRELTLDIDEPDVHFRAGQSVGVLAPGDAELGADHHFRLYSIADVPERGAGNAPRVKICVRRCYYIDDYSGERYDGVASNYLCDLKPGDSLTMAGPYGIAFPIPHERDANLILVGMGTGIAPFRAFVKDLYREHPFWNGRVILFHGGTTGLDLLYQNDQVDDFSQYYDKDTFEAIQALSPRPHWSAPIDWERAIGERAVEVWDLLQRPDTYVYVAGLERIRDELDAALAQVAGDEEKWRRRRAELVAGGRWKELLY